MGIYIGTIGRRDASRLRVNMPAQLDLIGGVKRCLIADVSLSGARVFLDDPPKTGEFGVLLVSNLKTFGTIVWASKKACGFRFDESISNADLIGLRQVNDLSTDIAKQDVEEFARKWVQGG